MLDSLFPVFIQHINELEEDSKTWSVVYEGKYEDSNKSYRQIGRFCFPIDEIDIEGNFIGNRKRLFFYTYGYELYRHTLDEWCGIDLTLYFGKNQYRYRDMVMLLQGIIKLNNEYSNTAKKYLDKLNQLRSKADEINNKTREVIKRNINRRY